MSESRFTAVLDRFEEDTAVLLLEADGETVEELSIPKTLLPPAGRRQDAVFSVVVTDVDRTELVFDPDRTTERADDAQSRFDHLSKSLSSGDDDRRD